MKIPPHIRALILPITVGGIVPAIILALGSNTRLGGGVPAPYLYLLIFFGIIFIICGLVLVIYTGKLFHDIGKGTLAPWDPTRKLVVAGPYRFVRNPMIFGVFLIIAGEAVLFGSIGLAIYCALFLIVNHVYFIFSEEPGLVKRFGEEYLEYKKNVPRWIPRVRGWKG